MFSLKKPEDKKVTDNNIDFLSAKQLSDIQYTNYGKKLNCELKSLKIFLLDLDKKLIEKCEYELKRCKMFFKHECHFVKYILSNELFEFSSVCNSDYIYKYTISKIIPKVKTYINSMGYSIIFNIQKINNDENIEIKVELFWKSRKFKNIVHALIMFNRMYKEYLATKYKYGSKFSLEAEKRFQNRMLDLN